MVSFFISGIFFISTVILIGSGSDGSISGSSCSGRGSGSITQ